MHIIDAHQAPKGHFQLWVRRNGVLVPELCVDEPNLIVDLSKQTHARLLGGDVANRSVTTIAFGTSGAAVAVGNTTITDPFSKVVDAVTYPTLNSVKFDFSLSTAEANGKAISEFGLMTAGGALYARKIRPAPLNKESDLSFAGSWTINF